VDESHNRRISCGDYTVDSPHGQRTSKVGRSSFVVCDVQIDSLHLHGAADSVTGNAVAMGEAAGVTAALTATNKSAPHEVGGTCRR
jgi:hypothetical protein